MWHSIISLLGIPALIALAWVLSTHRNRFPWRIVFWGLGLQWAIALLILKTPAGLVLFGWAEQAAKKLEEFAAHGTGTVFGPLGNSEILTETFGPQQATILAITIAGTIILISSLSSLLFHWGILPRLVKSMALLMQRALRTSGSESLAAVANIFVGQTEAPLIIKPYLAGMTRSELLALMTGGMTTIAGSMLIVYVNMGLNAGHLFTASLMSAPGSLLMAKIFIPETETSQTAAQAEINVETRSINAMDAICRGASDGMRLTLNVVAMLIAFVAIVALANFLLGLCLRPFGLELTLQNIFGWLNAPFAWVMGIPVKDCYLVGQFLGERIILNEFIGYLSLTAHADQLEARSIIIATYALCGFANFGSVAIQIAGIGGLEPLQRNNLARLGLKSMMAGLLACYLTASIVGILTS